MELDASSRTVSLNNFRGNRLSGISWPTTGARRYPGIRLAHRLQESRV